jgi:DNA-3-methyladenine glycosylase II
MISVRLACHAPKSRRLYGVAGSLFDGYDLDGLDRVSAIEATAALVTLKGIGPWTAESYLLFCVGHPDVFPAGDLALQIAVQDGLGLAERPADKDLRRIAEAWSPWRAVAARLFWAHYKARRTERGATAATLPPPPAKTRSRRRAPS